MAADGIRQMLERRGLAVGTPRLHAHQFRHTAAHRWIKLSSRSLLKLDRWNAQARAYLGRFPNAGGPTLGQDVATYANAMSQPFCADPCPAKDSQQR
jgi:hypothetical protein